MMLLAILLTGCTADDDAPGRRPGRQATPVVQAPVHSTPDLPTLTAPTTTPFDPGAATFDPSVKHDVRLFISPEIADRLRDHPEAWQKIDVIIDDHEMHDVAVRLKGHGSFQPYGAKANWKLSLDRYVADQEHDGLDQLVLNNMTSDGTMLAEHYAYRAYRAFGIPAPRSVHVRVVLNGEFEGTYLMVEEVDKRFLSRWYDDNDGSLYEMHDVDFVDDDVPLFDHDSGPDDRDPLYALADILGDPDQRLVDEGDDVLDVDQFTRYLGMSAVIGQFDAYPYSVPGDDLYLYVDPADGRIDVLPHGADETFGDRHRPVHYLFGRLGRACIAEPSCEQRFHDAIWSALEVVEDPAYIADLNDDYDNLTRARAMETRAHDEDPDTAFEAMREFLFARGADLEAQPELQ